MSHLCLLKDAALAAGQETFLPNWTFSQLDQMARRATHALKAAGVRAGDRVGLLHPADWQWIAFTCAIWRIGATVVPFNPRMPRVQIKEIAQKLKLYFVAEDLTPFFISEIESSLETISLTAPAFLLMTSGSIAEPKVIPLTFSNLIASAAPAIEWLDLRAGDRWLLALPLHHVGGIGVIIRSLIARTKLVFDPYEATHISYVPTQLYRTLHHPIPPSLRVVLIGGAALPFSLYKSAIAIGWPLYLSYGLTEMSSLVLCTNHPTWKEGLCYLKEPLPLRELSLASDGEILVRGHCLFERHNPLTWFPTRDIGQYDESAGFAITGRKDWQFISGGENIQPEEIEQELLRLLDLEEAVVVPASDPEFGQRPVLFVRTKNGSLQLSDVQKALKTRLPSHKIPVALYPLNPLPEGVLKRDRKLLISSIL